MNEIFLSYAREDASVASRLADLLQSDGLRMFLDKGTLASGEHFSSEIIARLREASAVIVLLSTHSKGKRWVEEEIALALERGKVIVPVLLDADAKQNWIWPLVADRQAIRVEDTNRIEPIVTAIRLALRPAIAQSQDSLPALLRPPLQDAPSPRRDREGAFEETPRRFEVFIGSSRSDFLEFRNELIPAVLSAGQIPTSMELWATAGDPVNVVVGSSLEQSDIHLLLVGARYGDLEPLTGLSYTEWEYEESLKANRPVLAFMLDDADFKQARADVVDHDPEEKAREAKLLAFRSKVRSRQYTHQFRTADRAGLQTACLNAIHTLVRKRGMPPEKGWIRASDRDVVRVRKIRDNRFLSASIDRLAQFSTLTDRVLKNERAKETAAMNFWQQMTHRILERQINHLFFESGSTLAYVAEAFEEDVLVRRHQTDRWTLLTNNVLALLQFTLQTNETVARFPSASPDPDDPYGAMFPPEWREVWRPAPTRPRVLNDHEKKALNKLRQNLPTDSLLCLATTSGLDIDNPVEEFRGPHVGSHPNMLFKRALITSGAPVVLFLHAEKLGDPFVIGKCYPIFDQARTWSWARNRAPLAVCVGWDAGKAREHDLANDGARIRQVLLSLGFAHSYFDCTEADGRAGAMMMGNSVFDKILRADRDSPPWSAEMPMSETDFLTEGIVKKYPEGY